MPTEPLRVFQVPHNAHVIFSRLKDRLKNQKSAWVDRLLGYATHPLGPWFLALNAFTAAIFFPLPPDPLFILLSIENRKRLPFLMLLTGLSSALGGLVTYGLGWGLYQTVGAWIFRTYGGETYIESLTLLLDNWGVWLLVVKAFTPIPFKVLALVCGVGKMNILAFFVASFVGRTLRFAAEGCAVWLCGPWALTLIQKHAGIVLATFTGLTLIGFVLLRFF